MVQKKKVTKKASPKKAVSLTPKQRVLVIIKILKKEFPDAHCSLSFQTPFQLAVATILSAQCTDERVNQVTPKLFQKFPDEKAMSEASLSQIESLIRSTGFYRNKAKSISEMSKSLYLELNGEFPRTLEKIIELRGIGRKTGNVILGTAFGLSTGVVVDTHVGRLSRRMGLTREKDPVKVEQDLVKIVPKKDWIKISHLFIEHGRKTCQARNAKCDQCSVEKICKKVL